MRSSLRFGLMAAAVGLIVAVSVLPADAQRRRSGSGPGAGPSVRAAQPARGGATVGQAVPRGSNAQAKPGAGPAGGPPPAGGGRGRPGGPTAVPRPPGGGPGPVYGRGGGPVYGPGYGYGGRYPGYGSSFYFAFGGFYGPYYWSPWFYSPYWYDPFWYGQYYPPYGYGWGQGYNAANLKVQVEPKNAEVYVDGRLAGIVDHFDGMFQSLMLEAGAHDVIVYLDGYRSIHEQLYLNVGSTYRIKGVMEKLAPGEPGEPRPQPSVMTRQRPVQAGPEPPDNYYPPPAQSEPRAAEPAPSIPPVAADSRFGQIAIRVQPGDAEVLIDGEAWRNPPGADRLVVHLSPGTHRVEIRKEGFDPFVTAVDITRGETAVLNVSLTRF